MCELFLYIIFCNLSAKPVNNTMYCIEKNYDSKTNRQMAVAFLTKTGIGLRGVKIVFFCFFHNEGKRIDCLELDFTLRDFDCIVFTMLLDFNC